MIPSPRPLKEGHYTGATAQDEPISFDVVAGGTVLTNLSFMIKASCSPDKRILIDQPITITGLFPIGIDGHFGDTVTGSDIEAAIEGTVSRSACVNGTLRVRFAIVCGERKVAYSTGEVSWTAQMGR